MFNVNELYELLKTNDFEDVRDAFDMALDEAKHRRDQEAYKFGTRKLPDEWYARIDDNKTTLEDVVLLMYTVLYRDYPEMRKHIEKVDISKEAKEILNVINLINNPNNIVGLIDKLFDDDNHKKIDTTSKIDKATINDFLKVFS